MNSVIKQWMNTLERHKSTLKSSTSSLAIEWYKKYRERVLKIFKDMDATTIN
jgi:hypothetical protein